MAASEPTEQHLQDIGSIGRMLSERITENARLTALLAERDAEIARLREAGNGMADAIDAYHDRLSRSSMGQPSPMTGMQKPLILWRAALAARGGEVQG